MTHTKVLSPLDILVLTATIDDRREIMKIQRALTNNKNTLAHESN